MAEVIIGVEWEMKTCIYFAETIICVVLYVFQAVFLSFFPFFKQLVKILVKMLLSKFHLTGYSAVSVLVDGKGK